MKSKLFNLFCFSCLSLILQVKEIESSLIVTSKLKFKLSGRNLIDQDEFSTTDGYVKASYTNDGGKTIKSLGRTEIIMDKFGVFQRNPDWTKVFEFHFDRKLKQYWLFHIYDHDPFKFDDTVGKVWINVADFVDKNQLDHANLDNGGYLTVKALPETIITRKKKRPSGHLPFPRGTPNSKRIRFTVSSRGLQRNTNHYETLNVTVAEGVNGKEKLLGKATTVTASFNPLWKKVCTVDWNKTKDQRLHFKIYDGASDKSLQESDIVGDAWIQVNDFIAKGDSFTVLLPKSGSLTITKA